MAIHRGFAVLAVLVGLIGLAVSFGPSPTSAADPARAAEFVAVSVGPEGQENTALYSSVTGALTRRLATFGESFTNNGLAVAPDRSAVYFTLIPRHTTLVSYRQITLSDLSVPACHVRRVPDTCRGSGSSDPV